MNKFKGENKGVFSNTVISDTMTVLGEINTGLERNEISSTEITQNVGVHLLSLVLRPGEAEKPGSGYGNILIQNRAGIDKI